MKQKEDFEQKALKIRSDTEAIDLALGFEKDLICVNAVPAPASLIPRESAGGNLWLSH